MKGYIILVLVVLGISMFCGIIPISIGMGSVFTQLNQVAGPIVCGNRQLEVVQHVSSYRPGETSWSITAYCVDKDPVKKEDVTILVQLVSGAIYGLVIFGIAIIALVWISFKNKDSGTDEGKTVSEPPGYTPSVPNEEASDDVAEKLRKLKQLHDDNLITDQDFEKKKAEILENL